MRKLWQMWPAAISDELIDQIEKIAVQRETFQGIELNLKKHRDQSRTSSIRWLSDQYWLRDQLFWYVMEANRAAFGVDICNVAAIQYTEYLGSREGHYDWHRDVVWNSDQAFDRKISVTVQLSDDGDYKGGDFQFSESENPVGSRKKGTVLVFPSYVTHRVTPVTQGKRKSLVAWFEGPKWR